MDGQTVEFILRARDEASAEVRRLSGELTGLQGGLRGVMAESGVFALLGTGIAAAVAAGAAASISFATVAEHLGRISERTGVGVERLQVWQQVIQEAGGDGEVLVTALTRLNRAIGEQNPLLGKLGITSKDTATAFTQLVTVLAGSEDKAKVTAVAFKLLGRGSVELIADFHNLLTKTGETDERMRRLSALIGEDAVAKGEALHKEVETLGLAFKGLWVTIGSGLVPMTTGLVNMVTGFITAARSFASAVYEQMIGPLDELAARKKEMEPALLPPTAARNTRTGRVGILEQAGYGPEIGGVEVSAQGRKDTLAGIDLGGGGRVPKFRADSIKTTLGDARDIDEFNKRVALLVTMLGRGREEAEALAGAFMDREAKSKGQDELDKMFPNLVLLPSDQRGKNPTEGFKRQKVLTDWSVTLKQMGDSAQVLDQRIQSVFNATQSAVGSLAQNIINGMGIVSAVWDAAWRSMADLAIQELERVAAMWVVNTVLKFLGLPAAAASAGASAAGAGAGAAAPRRAAVPINVTINALNQRGVEESLNNPRGELRLAFEQRAVEAAY